MRRFWLGTILLAIVAGLVVTHAATLGMQAVWPFFLGVALAPLSARGHDLPRAAVSAAAGVGFGVAVFVAVSEWMPFIPISFGITVAVAIAFMGVVSLRAPVLSLRAMLISFAAFYGVYEAQWVADRAAFKSQAAAAAASVLLSLLSGLLASFAISHLLSSEAGLRVTRADQRESTAGGVM